MGEFSKRIGDHGEEIVSDFLRLIGWESLMENIEIQSIDPVKHGRKTNGIDRLFHYKSPMINNTIENIIVSSKFTTNKYPSLASAKTTFKAYYKDIAETIESFKANELKNNILTNYEYYDTCFDRGVIFWLSNADNEDEDIIRMVSNSEIDNEYTHDGIYLMDNNRVGFIYDSLKYPLIKFKRNIDIDFIYFITGLNSNDTNLRNGKVLPVQLINSSVLPIRIFDIEKNETTLYLSCISSFEPETLLKLMGLLKNISCNMQVNSIICFPDYKKSDHEQIVNNLKQSMNDSSFTARLIVDNYNSPIIN